LRGYVAEQIAPYEQFVAQLQNEATLEQADQLASQIIDSVAAELGTSLDVAEVRSRAEEVVIRQAEQELPQLLAAKGYPASWAPAVANALRADPFQCFELLAVSHGCSVGEVARMALESPGRGVHAERTRVPGRGRSSSRAR
jgi:hypothetical protein